MGWYSTEPQCENVGGKRRVKVLEKKAKHVRKQGGKKATLQVNVTEAQFFQGEAIKQL